MVTDAENRIPRRDFAMIVRDGLIAQGRGQAEQLGGTWQCEVAVGRSPENADVLRANVWFTNAGGDSLESEDLLFDWRKWSKEQTRELRDFVQKFAKLKLTPITIRVLVERSSMREGKPKRDPDDSI